MKFSEVVEVDNTDNLYNCLMPDIKELSDKRFNCTMELKEDKIVLNLQATDETAFKAVKNSINNILKIHKKTKSLINSLN